MKLVFQKDSFLSARREAVFAFHEREDAFRLLTPPSFPVELESTASTIALSEQVVRFRTRVAGLSFPFAMVHTVYRPPELFVDEQLRGFFSTWKHEHRFLEAGWSEDPATMLTDRIDCSHPLLVAGSFMVRRRLASLFEARHEVTRRELAGAMREGRSPGHVVVTGATGSIGRRLTEVLLEKGARVTVLARDPGAARRLLGDRVACELWDFTRPEERAWQRCLEGADAVVHLAGTPLFERRWTDEFQRSIERSRTLSTRSLVEAIESTRARPGVLVCASAVGYYGLEPGRLVDETSEPADDLLARICVAWEREAREVERLGVRSAHLRIGVVLSPDSGALAQMLPLFRYGLGGVLGRPDGWINWIHIEDVVRIVLMAVLDDSLRGPLNAVSPHPVTNKTFAHCLAHALRRPCIARYPPFVLRRLVGPAARYASGGSRVRADRARHAGYRFFFDELEPALRSLLRRPA